MRAVAGIVIGLIASVIAAMVVGIVVFATTFSLPAGTNGSDMHQVVAILTSLPMATQLGLAVAWLAAGLAGALVAKVIARMAWVAWTVTLLVTLYFGFNGLVLPLPMWVQALWFIAPLLGGLLGNRLVGAAPVVVTTEAEAPPANP